MKLIRIILKLKKYFEYYSIYNGVIDNKYHFTSLKSENFDVVFYDEMDFCYRIIDKNMRGTDIPSKRNIIHDLSIICDNESFEIKKHFNSLGRIKRKIIIKLSKNFKKFECYMTPYISY